MGRQREIRRGDGKGCGVGTTLINSIIKHKVSYKKRVKNLKGWFGLFMSARDESRNNFFYNMDDLSVKIKKIGKLCAILTEPARDESCNNFFYNMDVLSV